MERQIRKVENRTEETIGLVINDMVKNNKLSVSDALTRVCNTSGVKLSQEEIAEVFTYMSKMVE